MKNLTDSTPMLFIWPGCFMYIGQGVDTVIHKHHAVQIAISFGEPIEIIAPGLTQRQRAVLIDSDVEHQCRTGNTSFLLLNIDPESSIGLGLKELLAGRRMAPFPENSAEQFLADVQLPLTNRDLPRVREITQQMLSNITQRFLPKQLDIRVTHVLDLLSKPHDASLKVKDLAAAVYISPSRLIHLFTDQVGIPIRKYILWRRLLAALCALTVSRSIADAALEGDFTDAPHFNRTFKRMFGLHPTQLLNNSQFVQVIPS